MYHIYMITYMYISFKHIHISTLVGTTEVIQSFINLHSHKQCKKVLVVLYPYCHLVLSFHLGYFGGITSSFIVCIFIFILHYTSFIANNYFPSQFALMIAILTQLVINMYLVTNKMKQKKSKSKASVVHFFSMRKVVF